MSTLADGLRFALVAERMGLVPRERFLAAFSKWLDAREGAAVENFEEWLVQAEGIDEESRAAIREGCDSSAGRTIAPELREALLATRPPEELRAWIRKLARAEGNKESGGGSRYRLGAEIARGGLGAVVEGMDEVLGREVAVKLILDDARPEIRERFVREARITARLDHPNVVPVHDFGEMAAPGGGRRLFLCMKRIRGRDLGALIRALAAGDTELRKTWSRLRLLRVFQDVCLGIAYAHSKGVLHRDLKPSNVMIGDFGETLIVDWGIAKAPWAEDGPTAPGATQAAPLPPRAGPEDATVSVPEATSRTDATQLTMVGDVIGTPTYMPPEQAEGRVDAIDARSDVYALGAILYAILTWRSPFEGTRASVLADVKAGRLVAPNFRLAALDPATIPERIAPDLESLCIRAMSRRPADRHPSAQALHDDIQAFLEGARIRERAALEAAARTGEGRRHLERFRTLAAEIELANTRVSDLRDLIKSHAPIAEKRPLWDAEARLRTLEEERIEAYARASAQFGQALVARSDSEEARDGTCELYAERFLEAAKARDAKAALLARRMLEEHDRDGRHRARLDAPGRVTLRAFTFGCDCVRARREPGWGIEIDPARLIAWRDGAARPDLTTEDSDRPVPHWGLRAGVHRWGHRPDCARRPLAGVEVRLARYVPREKWFELEDERGLGAAPVADLVLPQGSYLVTLRAEGFAESRVALHVTRDARIDRDVPLFPAAEVPDGFLVVPGGPYTFGGRWADGAEDLTKITGDLFVSRDPVLASEYIEFLNDLGLEKGRPRAPREAGRSLFDETGGRFAFSRSTTHVVHLPSPEVPVIGISWGDAVAYCEWRSARDGRPYRLLHEEEWEKVARGEDGRTHSWGEHLDPSFCNMSGSFENRPHLVEPGRFPHDISPYGLRDVCGNAATWCWNRIEVPHRHYVSMRGGAFNQSVGFTRTARRRALSPVESHPACGFRLCVPVMPVLEES